MLIVSVISNISVEIRTFLTFVIMELNLMIFDTGPQSLLLRVILAIIISLVFSVLPDRDEAHEPDQVEQEPTEMVPTLGDGFDEVIITSEGISRLIHQEESS